MESIIALENACRVATAHDIVLNAECCYTFHTPYTTPQGIVVHLKTFMGTVQEMALLHDRNDSQPHQALFVRIVKQRLAKAVDASVMEGSEDAVTALPTVLGVGVQGGFASEDDKFDTISNYSVVVLQKNGDMPPMVVTDMPYNDETKSSFPAMVAKSVDSIINHVGLSTQQDVQVWKLDAAEDTPISKYAADLPFVDNGVMIDPNPASWKCLKSGDTENLWLNLSDGYIGGGRKNWDGSGGSNGALDHFEETGRKYPLVVKLGTITADLDTADCYSYAPDEDGPVKIPNLEALLEKRGIKISSMQKTVKSTTELEVELNATYAFDAITEAGSELKPVAGPGLQGLQNLGNSCYMNSVVQLLLSGTVPELAHRYGTGPFGSVTNHPFLTSISAEQAPSDVLCQTAKLACALTSGIFSQRLLADADGSKDDGSTDPKYRLAPRMMKHCIGKDHVDFRTGQQQDAAQFLQYLLERLDRAELGARGTLARQEALSRGHDSVYVSSHLFSFKVTSRMVCGADGLIKYKDDAFETMWSLRIPMDKAVVIESAADKENVTSPENKRLKAEEAMKETAEKKEPVPTISFLACVEEWAKETQVEDIRWPHLGDARFSGQQQLRFANFPRYLLIQMQRYQLGPDWTPVKLEVKVDIPEEIDLTELKSYGAQPNENLVPEATGQATSAPSAPSIDEVALSQLMEMGFSLNSCKRALNAVGGSDVEAAMGWVFEHNNDPDFNDPLPVVSKNEGSGTHESGLDEGVVHSLVESLGCFSADQVRVALKQTDGMADRAADWLFSHMDNLDEAIASVQKPEQVEKSAPPSVDLEDGPGKYNMVGMISHIGKHTGSGHYVAHLKKDGQWVIFNDEKVALSLEAPFHHAYLYLFQRADTFGAPNPHY